MIKILKNDKSINPIPEDFNSPDGFTIWKKTIGGPFQQVLCDLIYGRYLDIEQINKPIQPKSTPMVNLFFKVVEARNLLAKDGKSRDAYCLIDFGPENGLKNEVFNVKLLGFCNRAHCIQFESSLESAYEFWNKKFNRSDSDYRF